MSYLQSFKQLIENEIGKVSKLTPLSGGSINDAYKVETSSGVYFLKYNLRPKLFLPEIVGLQTLSLALKECSYLIVPEIIFHNEHLLILEFIDNKEFTAKGWSNLAYGLRFLHSHNSDKFGFKEDNLIGSTKQVNVQNNSWGEFFFNHRLVYQQALQADEFKYDAKSFLENNKDKLIDLLNSFEVIPSLVHGDLWSGNVMCDLNDRAVIIDPAVYYGDPDVDYAMASLFGGFGKSFWENSPQNRKKYELYNLYHILNHCHIFGGSYQSQARKIMDNIDSNL